MNGATGREGSTGDTAPGDRARNDSGLGSEGVEGEGVGEIVLVTGVSRGIGAGLVREWLRRGAHVLGLGRTAAPDFADHARFRHATADVVDPVAVRSALDRLLEGHPVLHRAILNAGVLGRIRDFAETPLDDAKALFDVNVWANKTIIDELVRRPVRVHQIVTVSSGAAVNLNRGWGAYALSKAALNALTTVYSRELPDTHLAALAPGLVDTAMQDHLCALPADSRFTSLEVLRMRRGTPDMPDPRTAARLLIAAIEALPTRVESGAFVDVRAFPGGLPDVTGETE